MCKREAGVVDLCATAIRDEWGVGCVTVFHQRVHTVSLLGMHAIGFTVVK